MLAVALALLSAVSFGASDYAAWPGTRKASARGRGARGPGATSLTVALLVAPWFSPLLLSVRRLAGWSAAAGVAGIFGALTLYMGFRHADFSVASMLSAVGSAALPALAGLLFGERPPALPWPGSRSRSRPSLPYRRVRRGGRARRPRQDATGRRPAGVARAWRRAQASRFLHRLEPRGQRQRPVAGHRGGSGRCRSGSAAGAGQAAGLPPPGSRSLAAVTGATGAIGTTLFFARPITGCSRSPRRSRR